MTPEAAQNLALEALNWLLSSDDLAGVFMGASGLDVGALRTRIEDPELLGSVLDFLLMDDTWVQGFCDQGGYDYLDPMRARQSLPGGDVPHWT